MSLLIIIQIFTVYDNAMKFSAYQIQYYEIENKNREQNERANGYFKVSYKI